MSPENVQVSRRAGALAAAMGNEAQALGPATCNPAGSRRPAAPARRRATDTDRRFGGRRFVNITRPNCLVSQN